MTLPFEANCLPMAPFVVPYPDHRAALTALMRWTPNVVAWPVLTTEPDWWLAAVGFPGLVNQTSVIDWVAFETASEAHQLAFLRNDLQHAAVLSFIRQVEGVPWDREERPEDRVLVISLFGPISLGLTLVDQDERPVLDNLMLREALAQHLRLRAGWLEQTVGDISATTLLAFDEPFWNALSSPFMQYTEAEALLLVEECFGSVQSGRALIPYGVSDWQRLIQSSLSLLVCQPAERAALLACGRQLNDYFERGGVVAWALVPGNPADRSATSVDALKAEWEALVRYALDADVLTSRLLGGSLLTISSGLASASPADADAALELLAHVARAVRAHYKLS